MTTKICPLCVSVSALWLVLSAGVAWGYLAAATFLLPIALLMGGSVVGVANRFTTVRQKGLALVIGFPLAYLLVINLSPLIVGLELLNS